MLLGTDYKAAKKKAQALADKSGRPQYLWRMSATRHWWVQDVTYKDAERIDPTRKEKQT